MLYLYAVKEDNAMKIPKKPPEFEGIWERIKDDPELIPKILVKDSPFRWEASIFIGISLFTIRRQRILHMNNGGLL